MKKQQFNSLSIDKVHSGLISLSNHRKEFEREINPKCTLTILFQILLYNCTHIGRQISGELCFCSFSKSISNHVRSWICL
jgi:hypothetical protein